MGVSVQVLNIPICNLEVPLCVDGLIRMCEMNLLWMDITSYSTTLTLPSISMVQGYHIYKDVWPVTNPRPVEGIPVCSVKLKDNDFVASNLSLVFTC